MRLYGSPRFRRAKPTPQTPGHSGAPSLNYAEQMRRPGGVPASLLGIVLAFVAYFTIVPLLSLAVTGAAYFVQAPSVPLQEFRESAARYEIPAGLAANGIAIAALIPLCWLLMTRLHCVPFGRLSSVEGRLRRPYLALCLGIATFIIIGGTVLVTALQGQRLEIAPQPGWWGFVTVVAVVTPWQAAAEEYLFRGYLLQALGSLMSSPWLGATVSSLLFAGLHGTQNPALFVDRFAFGLLASGLVILTGGLEAGIAAHIVNNLGAFTIAALTTSLAQIREVRTITWADALTNVAIFATFAAAAFAAARLLRLPKTTTAPPNPFSEGCASENL